jgi:hypothetical protein
MAAEVPVRDANFSADDNAIFSPRRALSWWVCGRPPRSYSRGAALDDIILLLHTPGEHNNIIQVHNTHIGIY